MLAQRPATSDDDPFTYYVVLQDGRWRIRYGGRLTEPYATQHDAIGAAVWAGHALAQSGRSAQVLVQGPDGGFHGDWTYDYHPDEDRRRRRAAGG